MQWAKVSGDDSFFSPLEYYQRCLDTLKNHCSGNVYSLDYVHIIMHHLAKHSLKASAPHAPSPLRPHQLFLGQKPLLLHPTLLQIQEDH